MGDPIRAPITEESGHNKNTAVICQALIRNPEHLATAYLNPSRQVAALVARLRMLVTTVSASGCGAEVRLGL
jgi:hypothetical protein